MRPPPWAAFEAHHTAGRPSSPSRFAVGCAEPGRTAGGAVGLRLPPKEGTTPLTQTPGARASPIGDRPRAVQRRSRLARF
ncbi:hypothetical protein ACFPK5_00320 [Streptomyces beijiangensis]|uniref:hypothetical protein n=1 Tax=Streptomyces beijiangensis TaxID=163361 RepID=UPI00360651A5